METKVSAKDVARYVGVSVATVSNVVNNINKVSEETRQKVLKAIEELQYQPDFTARSLAKRKSNLLGVMLPITEQGDDKSLLLKDNPFYAEFISGIEYEAGRRGYDVLITGIRPHQSLKDWVRKRNIDGVIFLGIYSQAFLSELKSLHVPVVLMDTHRRETGAHNIGTEDQKAGDMACQYLIHLGHRNIALATGSIKTSPVNENRYKGYVTALKRADIPILKELIFEEQVSFEGGYRIGERIAKDRKGITAVFCVADIVAFGLMKALKENGLQIPEDISVMGFDNLKTCDYLFPGLTTIDQGIYKKGVIAVEFLVNDIEGIDHTLRSMNLPVKIVERNSTKAPGSPTA
ncbi:MAG: LacI family transcriptional regulator [Clostridia bacterium]|nr:LacI family transcriptional regulator [Clostridia bacterium]